MATVVLDAGHGGTDPGAVNGSRREADDNLKLTLAIGNILKQCGVNVVYTRTTDVFVTLGQRSIISNNANADLFVSLHRNSNTNTAANGFEVHIYTNPSQQAINLANNIVSFVANTNIQSNRGVQRSNFSVLRQTRAPAVLVEMGFVSNAQDNILFDDNYNSYASAIASGILTTLGINCSVDVPPPTTPATPTSGIIEDIQRTLNAKYNAGLIVDGMWGPLSQAALLKALQLQINQDFGSNLVVDGMWGPITKSAVPLLRINDRGNLVYILQAALYVHGLLVKPDGIFGQDTKDKIMQLQQQKGLSVDGIAGPNTFAVLFGG